MKPRILFRKVPLLHVQSKDFKSLVSRALSNMLLMSAEAQRQAGSGQTGGIIEGERSGDPPIGQTVATAAAQFLSGALGGNQQQVQFCPYIFLTYVKVW